MKTVWTQHLNTDADKDRFRTTVKASKQVLDRLKEILDGRVKAINSIETGVDIYTKPGWEALLVHYNSEKGVLKWVQELINLDQEGTTNDRQHTG